MKKTTTTGHMMAVLAASGLHENDLTETQKAVQKTNIGLRIIGMDQGLLSSWNAEGWGLSYMADTMLNQALAADYDGLIILGGRRSVDKLKQTAHTKRFIGGFIDNGKTVIAIDEGVELLAFAEKIAGRTVAVSDAMKAQIEAAGATCTANMIEQDGNLMTVSTAQNAKVPFAGMITEFLNANFALKNAA